MTTTAIRHHVNTDTLRCEGKGCRKPMCFTCGGCSSQCNHSIIANLIAQLEALLELHGGPPEAYMAVAEAKNDTGAWLSAWSAT